MISLPKDIESPLPESGRPAIVAGPCSAESLAQMLDTAKPLAGMGIRVFRAGLWKPRTMPGGFEGVGAAGLDWLAEVKRLTGMLTATEVATPAHAHAAIEAGVDILWIGARTSANPFAVQELAEAIAAHRNHPGVLVKNPVSPDLNLWLGAIKRLADAGIRRLGAIHRGFASYGEQVYRNRPHWSIPFELHRMMPSLTLLCDPSHIAGRRGLVEDVARKAMGMPFDGLIVETHCCPDCALSDAAQQLTPDELASLIASLKPASTEISDSPVLAGLREQIDGIDDSLIALLAKRMELSEKIGYFKRQSGLSIVQPDRYNKLMESRVAAGVSAGLDSRFLRNLLGLIHEESVKRQL